MPKLRESNFFGELLHFNSMRLRVVGSGVLRSTLYSLDAVRNKVFPNLTLSTATNREPTLLNNFTEQRAYYKIEVTDIDEYFVISKLTLFIKPTATGYPQ